jgi:N-acetylmuramoyl-L-alanine amidase
MEKRQIRNSRRKFIKFSLTSAFTMAIAPQIFAQESTKLIGSRMWPSASYTRVTFESNNKLNFKYFTLENPLRLVMDIEGVEIKDGLSDLTAKALSDKYISGFRVGINRPNVTRIVFELKEKIKPQIFTIEPVEKYGHRLVLDIYPENDPDLLFTQIIEKERQKKTTELEVEKKDNSPKKKQQKLYVVALDAGHGGEDPGAIGASGTHEKDITLAVARKMKERMDEIPWIQAVLIRDGDYFIPLNQRVEKARKAKADLFISIHADAVLNREAKGSSVYILSEKGASSATSKFLEQKENDADMVGGMIIKKSDDFLARTLFDLSMTATITESSKLALSVLREMAKINDLHKKQVESAGFAVLKAHDIPSILIETAFISNREEEKKLKDKVYQEKIVDAVITGISKYANVSA